MSSSDKPQTETPNIEASPSPTAAEAVLDSATVAPNLLRWYDRLKELESHHLVERTVYPGPPVRVQYALTLKGQPLR